MATPDYDNLREQIEGLLTEGRQLGRRAVEWEKVETYWHIGDAMLRYLEAEGGTTHGQQTIRNLSKDINLGEVILYEIIRFRRQISTLHARVNLGWSHYRALLSLPPDRFSHYELLADEQAWTTRQLKQAIEAETGSVTVDLDLPAAPLRPYFGEPFTYRVVPDALSPQTAIDFGFYNVWVPDRPLGGFDSAKAGDTIRLDTHNASAHVLSGRPKLWTFTAGVGRIIDGDTLDVAVDLGLGHRAFPRLRLRGVDTPELFTEAGRRSRAFVEEALAPVDRVVISTRRTDVYGRYLADVKYLADATNPLQTLEHGTYLNRQLLDEGLASRYLD